MASIISISSHVAYGAVGNRIIIPAVEALGISTIALNTVQLPWHPGMNARYGTATRIVPDDLAFAAMIDNLAEAPWLGEIDGIITGYLGSPAQTAAIAKLVKALKHANPNALYLCDPVIGDTGGLYVPEATALAIRNQLWPLADIVTPNKFEFGWMTGKTSASTPDIIKTAKALKKRHVVVTSMETSQNHIGNLLVTDKTAVLLDHQALSPTPNGTGDLLAALFLAHLINGAGAADALAKSAAAVVSAIRYANQHHKFHLSPEHFRVEVDGDLAEIHFKIV